MTGGVFAYLQADNDRKDLDVDSEDINAEKMSRFIRMNELRLVTEYNPVVITSSSQPSPQHSVSSSWASSGPSVYACGCMQGLHSGVTLGDGEDTQLFAATAQSEREQVQHQDIQVGWGGERRQFLWPYSKSGALVDKELHFLLLLLLPPLGICHVVPRLQTLPISGWAASRNVGTQMTCF